MIAKKYICACRNLLLEKKNTYFRKLLLRTLTPKNFSIKNMKKSNIIPTKF